MIPFSFNSNSNIGIAPAIKRRFTSSSTNCRNTFLKNRSSITYAFYSRNRYYALDVVKLFTSIEFNSLQPRFGCSLVPWTWWALQNWTFKGKVTNGSRISWENFFISKSFFCCQSRHLITTTNRQRQQQCRYVSRQVKETTTTKWPIWKKSKQKNCKRKSWSVGNFDFKCPILKCSSCSRDQATSKTRLWWIQLHGGKKFCDI